MGMRKGLVCFLIFMIFFEGFSSVSATTTPGRFVGGFFSNAMSALLKWAWSLSASTKTAISGRQMMKFESGYNVETVFDGSKLGIEPFSVEVLPSGDLLVLDSANSNIYRISPPLSRYSRPKLVAGSSEGYAGHIDGKAREARLNHPKGITVDDRGNIYVADAMNMAIRKISDTGVTTIAGGKWSRGGGHVDGPSQEAKFSNDFEVVYIGSSCSLIVVDRGNEAIREIQLHVDDCAYEYGTGFPLGILVLVAAGFFGYMLALLQRRVTDIVSSNNEPRAPRKAQFPSSPYQKPLKSSVRPLIPMGDELEKEDEGFFAAFSNLSFNVGASFASIFRGLFSIFRKKSQHTQYQNAYHQQRRQNAWPMQESFVIPDEDEPPSIETRTPTPRKTYPFMSKDAEKANNFRLGRTYFNGRDGESLQQQQQQQQQQQLQQQHHQRHYSLGPHTYYEQSCETTTEIVFGAVQEDGKRAAVEIKPVNYGAPIYDHNNMRSRINYMGYNQEY